jgi:hypothetical protein
MRIYYMKKQLRFIFLLLILVGFTTARLTAQTAFGSEAELKAQAAKLFDDDQFEEAYPLYAQLASLYNKDPNYNFRLGVCMLYASEDKEKPIPFLELAAKYPDVDKEVFFYLAKAYHLNYRFDDAIKQYQAYQKVASGPKAEKLQVARQIEMCKNGKKLLRNISDLIVIDKKEMSRADFFRSYDISAIGGKLLAKPDEDTFKTPLDKKKKESSIIYFSSDNNQIYFSSYGDDLSHGKDIYLVRKLPNGELSKPQTLGYPVNTEYDEDFPFLHPNGKVLYFCSKGHNSMGGYDIFKTTLNELTNTWNKPVNLDFPINSPDDDVLYVTNADEKEAYFSSARASATGKTAVYHINVERKPMDVAIINGTIVKNSADQDMNVKITVKDLDDNTVLGIFNSKPESGDFVMNLPSGGKVMYTVESPGFPTQSEVVTLPSQTTLTPLKQEISFEPGTGKLKVKNSFDQPASDDNYLSVLSLIKEKSKMDVNVNDVAADNPSKTNGTGDDAAVDNKTTPVKTEKKPVNLSNEEIVKIAYNDAKDVEKEAKELKEQADLALVISNQKNEEAQSKTREVAALTSSAAQMTDNTKKQAALEQVKILNKEVAEVNQVTVATYNVAKALELKADAKQKEADLSMQYAKDLEAAVKSKSSKEALAKLDEQQKKLDAISQKNDASENISNSLKLDADNKKRELDKAIQTSADIKQEIIDNEAVIASTEADAAKEKNASAKQGLQDQVAGLKEDIANSKKELESNETKVIQLQKDYDGINNQIELFNSVVDKAKTGGNETVAADAAAIDKTKLEQQVNNLKNSDKTLASIKPIATENTGETKNADTSITPDIAKTNAAKPPVTEPVTAADHKTTESPTVTEPVTEPTKTVDKTTVNPETTNPITAADKNVDTIATPVVTTQTEIPVTETPTAVTAATDKTFEDALAATDVIADKTEKETRKAEVYQNWSTAINSDLSAKKLQLETETSPEKKNELAIAINTLEAKLKVTEQSKTETLALVEKLKQEQPVVLNTGKDSTTIAPDDKALTNPTAKTEQPVVTTQVDKQTPAITDDKTVDNKTEIPTTETKTETKKIETPTPLVSATTDAAQQLTTLEQVYNQEVTDAEKEGTDQEKENKKLKAAKNYVNAATLVVNSKKSDLTTEGDQSKQQSLNQDIALLEQNIAEKQKIADESTTKIVALGGTPVNTDNTAPVTTSKEPERIPVKNIIEPAKPFIYSNTTAKTNLDKATAIDKEGEDLLTQSKQLREQAALQTDVTEKNNMYSRADEMAASGESKKVEASQLVGTANTTEYRNNQHAIDQYANAVKNQTDELSIAELMKDEAKTYFEKAQNSRKAAAAFETYYAKESALDDANKNELIALQKQNGALAIYKKNNPKLPIKPLTALELATTTPVVKKDADLNPPATDATTTALNKEKPGSENKEKSVTATEQPLTNTTTNPSAVDTNKTNTTETPVIKEQPVTDNNVVKEQPVTDNGVVKEQPVTDNGVVKEQPPVMDNTNNPVKEKTTDTPVVTTENGTKEEGKKTTQPLTTPDNAVVSAKLGKEKTKSKASRLKELFERRSKSGYSASRPIPIDEKLPDGLVFKVQMGAFKNVIPQDLFKGISPVSGETTPKGFIRYTAGLFFTCESADKAKKEIRTLGFPDAFVVAFMDGKRIPPPCGGDGTVAILTPEEKTEVTVQPPLTTQPEIANPPVVTNPPVVKNNTEPATVSTVLKEIAEAKDVTTFSGLFYTIQVGVYSNPVSAAELNNIQPLYTENANNKVRYNVGIYNSIPLASEAKKIAINGGLKDAFMTIYYNGQRISMVEAATLTAQGVTPLASAPGINLLPTFKNGGGVQTNVQPRNVETPAVKNKPVQPATTTEKPVTTQKTVTPDATTPSVIPTKPPVSQVQEMEPGIVFKVQIGAFSQEVPLEIANKFLKIAKKGIKNYKDENGLTIYTVGKYATYEEADKSRQEVAAEGLPDAFIVAYADGKKIPVDEAQKLNGNK